MNRFAKTKKDHSVVRELLLPFALFVVVIVLFSAGLRSISATAQTEQLKATEQAIIKASVHCYAVEGSYPPTLSYLEERYGLTIDHEKYIVDYHCFASNIIPDVTVLPNNLPVQEVAQ